MTGGLGDDWFLVDSATDVVIEGQLGGTADRIRTTVTYALSSTAYIEQLTTTSFAGTTVLNLTGNTFAQAITGNAATNELNGLAGNDSIYGGDGSDTVNGGAGDDSMEGGNGDDTYYVNATGDAVTEASNGGADTVLTNLASYVLGNNVENLTAFKPVAFLGMGNSLANIITGNIGNDSLDGGNGKDTLVGGLGKDTYTVDSTGDVVTELAGGGIDLVQTSLASYTLGAEVERLIGMGPGAFNGTGNGLANSIVGNIGNDKLNGLDGDDTLTGGPGDDAFIFNTAPSATNRDTITDFNTGNDTIRLENTGVGLFNALANGALAASAFKLIGPGGAAIDADDRILYRQSTGQLFYDADGSNAGSAVLFATVLGNPVIDHSDFFVL